MFRIGAKFVISPSDLTNAVMCEFALLRDLDVKLDRIKPPDYEVDAMLARAAHLGDAYEGRVLAKFVAIYGPYDPLTGRGVYSLVRAASSEPTVLAAAAHETVDILRSGADVVYQAAFFRDRFNGFADFIVRDAQGEYAVYDSKLARHAKVSALLQLAAYGDELRANAIPTSSLVHLILGDSSIVSHDLMELIPVYRERRARLEAIIDEHVADGVAIEWNDPRFTACGRCDICAAEVTAHRDLLLVAGLRISQRSRLREAGVLTIDDLARRVSPVPGVRDSTLVTLQAQAAMQIRQSPSDGRAGPVVAEVFDPEALAVLPQPDAGDIYFDFEGDPLWSDGDPIIIGLEYLFGVLEVNDGERIFRPFWAHNRAEEKAALEEFLAYVQQRRSRFPGLHIYHYAAYETSALLRLSGRYGVGEAIVDKWLEDGVLVDLYSVIRTSLRISQPSYSLKKLEPLYMGEELRESDVKNAGDSIVAYADYCDLVDAGDTDAAAAQLRSIADYNEYDCVSTYRLRGWLVAQATTQGIELVGPGTKTVEIDTDDDTELVNRLMAFVGDGARTERSVEQQAIALLAASIGYHRRELKPFWWAHFDRLINPVADWADTGDVLIVDHAETVSDWSRSGRQRNDRRRLRLCGRLGIGSQLDPGDDVCLLYAAQDVPAGIEHNPGQRGVSKSVTIVSRGIDQQGRDEFEVEELCKSGCDSYRQLPMAVVPGAPIRSVNQHRAIIELAEVVATELEDGRTPADVLARQPSLQLLAQQRPRLVDAGRLPLVIEDGYISALSAAVRSLDGSYLAVQGPPGSGKTHIGAHVIAALVADGWSVGVLAQSHRVVENLLAAIVDAGVAANDIAKKRIGASRSGGRWTEIDDNDFSPFLTGHRVTGRGCVLGGTAWDFTNLNRVPPHSLDLLVIDEAGQFSLANTVACSTSAKRLLLLGDPQQLPQVSQGTHPEPCDDSALGWVVQGQRVMPADRGYFLARSWRMHPALTAAVSHLAYDGHLHSHDAVTANRSLAGVEPGLHVLEVAHVGNSIESAEEAAAVVATVTDLVGRRWTDQCDVPRPLTPRDILVVAPYNAQVAMIRRQLDHAGYTDTEVGSVDKFQGQEAPVVIVSMTASAPEDVPRGMDFLLSRNRVNVAISRGKWCAIVVRSPRLTDYLPANPNGLGRLGAFIRLCSSHNA